ncbi:glycoside hydrolase family 2 protein [Roseateles sp. DC23W]|uniref:beta-mannosidase n=1 Tax=Pelomonas dachongensis TaxID=3299029 RepID=A0ABW7EJJ7_9BURK
MIPERLIDLHDGWQLAEAPDGADAAALAAIPAADWLPAAVPGSAHGALLVAGRVPDPFYGRNEAQLRWVGERTWAWRLDFDVTGELAPREQLVFEGLDTYCAVWLNGELLLQSDNMFVPHRVDVRDRLRPGRNQLLLRFDPALARAREVEAVHGKRQLWNGDSARLHVRKAQYHFGWDWGPELIVSGPWRPVRRCSGAARIADLHCQADVDVAARRATLRMLAQIEGEGAQLQVELLDAQGRSVAVQTVPAAVPQVTLDVVDAQLWWPRGLGAQPLYTLVARVLDGDRVLAEQRRRIGLRTLRLLQQPVQGEAGSSFHFEVNGQELFAGGANWIPDDSLLERITPARYRERVAQAADANMNMLRVWGGGIYEHDAFYEACDELGVLVWQDFMFACGLYPANEAFQASVRAEAEAAVKRLRHHACLALWCGNNEDYMVAESVGLAGPGIPADRYEARVLYERLLPEVCAALDPDRVYWPGSPFTPGADAKSSDVTVGDRHSWEVWHQQMLPYQRYGEVQARFVSEFGMQSHPSLALFESVLPEVERFPESQTVQWHNKAGSGNPDGHRRLAVYLADNLRVGATLADHIYATQFVQAEAMRVAYQDFRRRWQHPGARAVGGALVWQLNDCWPVTSWALIDSAGVMKPAWHAVRRALAPLAAAVRLEAGQARLAVMNGTTQARALRLQLRVFALDGRLLAEADTPQQVAASSSVETTLVLPERDEPVVAELLALDAASGHELARDCAWTEPYKFYRLGGARIDVQRDGPTLLIAADRPVKGLWLQGAGAGAGIDDNFIDLVPGAPRRVGLTGRVPAMVTAVALDHPVTSVVLDRGG